MEMKMRVLANSNLTQTAEGLRSLLNSKFL